MIDRQVWLPVELFYNEDGSDGFYKKIGDTNIISVLVYLYSRTNRYNDVSFTIEELIKYSGNKVRYNTVEKMKILLNKLKEVGIITDIWIEGVKNFNSLKKGDFIEISLKFTSLYGIKQDFVYGLKIDGYNNNITLAIYMILMVNKLRGLKINRVPEIIRLTGLNRNTIKKYLDLLERRGLI